MPLTPSVKSVPAANRGVASGPGPWLAVAANTSYGAAYVVRRRTLPVPAFNDVITSSPFWRVNMKTRSPTMIGVA